MKKLNFLESFQNLLLDIQELKRLLLKVLSTLDNNQIAFPENKPLQEEWISVKETCKILGCSEVTLWKLRKDGSLKYSRLRRTIRLKRSDVYNYLNQKK